MSVTLAEWKKVVLAVLFSVSSTVTVQEDVSANIDFNINVNDAITVQETISPEIDFQIKPNDTVTGQENIQTAQESHVDVNDTVTVQENIQRTQESFVSINDTVTIAEQIEVPESLFISVSDGPVAPLGGPNVTESVSVDPFQNRPINSESVAAQENVAIKFDHLTIDVNETPAITENVTPLITGNIYVSTPVDTVATIEYRDVEIAGGQKPCIYVNENIAVTVEAGTVDRSISIHDTVAVSESFELTPDRTINIYDSISAQEDISTTIYVPGPEISVYDKIEVGDPWFKFNLDLYDSIIASENVKSFLDLSINVNDDISVAESSSVGFGLVVPTITETPTVSESVSIARDHTISVNDNVAVQDVYAGDSDLGNISVNEIIYYWDPAFPPPTGHWIAEDVSLVVTAIPTLFINVNDEVAVAENITLAPDLPIIVNDSVLVVEHWRYNHVEIPISISKHETVAVAESVDSKIFAAYAINVFDEIGTSELNYTTLVGPININVSESIITGEWHDASREARLNVIVDDDIITGECISREIPWGSTPDTTTTWTDVVDSTDTWSDVGGLGRKKC